MLFDSNLISMVTNLIKTTSISCQINVDQNLAYITHRNISLWTPITTLELHFLYVHKVCTIMQDIFMVWQAAYIEKFYCSTTHNLMIYSSCTFDEICHLQVPPHFQHTLHGLPRCPSSLCMVPLLYVHHGTFWICLLFHGTYHKCKM